MKPGDRIVLKGSHPWATYSGELVVFGSYGLRCLNLKGWLVHLDNGHECYADDKDIKEGA